jgi:CubicO group peptidase (beta-lactamase class C family)
VVPRFHKITVRELLAHSSGIDPTTLIQDVAATQLANHPLPMTVTDAIQYIAAQKLPNEPGKVYAYNDAAYFLLGAVDIQLRGQELAPLGFIDSMLENMLLPLGMHRVRPAMELIGDQPPDEARYATYGNRALSVMSAAQPQVDDNYGDESLAVGLGAKGLSASVVDVARLLASFSKSEPHPILNAATRTLMFQNGIATKAASESGSDVRSGHGFDDVTSVGNDEYHAQKGGQFTTSQDMIYLETEKGGVSYVVCWAGVSGSSWYPKWDAVLSAARAHNFHGANLFPNFLSAATLRP